MDYGKLCPNGIMVNSIYNLFVKAAIVSESVAYSAETCRARRARNQGVFFMMGAILALAGRLLYGVPSVSIPIHLLLMIALASYIWYCHRKMKSHIEKHR